MSSPLVEAAPCRDTNSWVSLASTHGEYQLDVHFLMFSLGYAFPLGVLPERATFAHVIPFVPNRTPLQASQHLSATLPDEPRNDDNSLPSLYLRTCDTLT